MDGFRLSGTVNALALSLRECQPLAPFAARIPLPVPLARSTHRQSSSRSARMKASGGISTEPRLFMRFLPSFCFSSNLRLRVTSPP